jgi:hypothetical protein
MSGRMSGSRISDITSGATNNTNNTTTHATTNNTNTTNTTNNTNNTNTKPGFTHFFRKCTFSITFAHTSLPWKN